MSGARRQRDSIAPSLFPFLAVLLCTMGALVLILMLVVASAQASAKQVATETQNRIEEAETQLAVSKRSYEERLAEGRIDLEKKRLVLQHHEEHIRELLEELSQLKRTAELLQEKSSTDQLAEQERAEEISELEKQLAEAAKKLQQKLDKPKGDKPIFAIIPYDGPNGTHRRPIYLVCTAEGVTIEPEGILINSDDLQPPYGPGNPLDAALRTIRSQYVPNNFAVTSTAYPLLVVRPSGIRAYSMARAAMSSWDDQFGYELIDEDLELVFPAGEPGLKEKIVQALDLARERQAALVMAMPRKYRQFASNSGSSYSDSFSGEGWEGRGGSSGTSASLAAGQSGRGGFGFPGTESASNAERRASSAGDGPAGFGDPSLGSPGSNTGMTDSGYGSQESLSAGGGPTATQPTPAGGLLASRNDNLPGSRQQQPGHSAEAGATAFDGPSGDSGDGASRSGNPSPGGSSQAGRAQAMNMSGSQIAIPSFASNPSGAAGGSSTRSAAGQSSNGRRASSGRSRSRSPSSTSRGSPSSSSRRASETTRPVASHRGRNWAWSQGPPTQTPVVRSIRMQCFGDRWVLLPPTGSTRPGETILLDGIVQERAEQLARMIIDRVDSWGLALAGGYWKPILVVEVADDASWRYDQLVRLLDGSGLEVQRRQRTP